LNTKPPGLLKAQTGVPYDLYNERQRGGPTISGKLLFHVIVDDFHRTFSIDGPGGPNGVRLHYEMRQVARAEKKMLRDFDLRADSHEAALAEMQNHFPGYQFLGTWASSQSN
jgi:hypothetical protein